MPLSNPQKNGNPRDNRIKNLRVRSIRLNRGKK